MHTSVHAHPHAYRDIYLRVRARMHSHTHLHVRVHVCMLHAHTGRRHMHTRMRTDSRLARIYAGKYARLHAHMCAQTRTHTWQVTRVEQYRLVGYSQCTGVYYSVTGGGSSLAACKRLCEVTLQHSVAGSTARCRWVDSTVSPGRQHGVVGSTARCRRVDSTVSKGMLRLQEELTCEHLVFCGSCGAGECRRYAASASAFVKKCCRQGSGVAKVVVLPR